MVNCYVDKNEPAMPGKVTTAQAIEFTKALARGERDTSEIIKNVIKDQFREAVATKGKACRTQRLTGSLSQAAETLKLVWRPILTVRSARRAKACAGGVGGWCAARTRRAASSLRVDQRVLALDIAGNVRKAIRLGIPTPLAFNSHSPWD